MRSIVFFVAFQLIRGSNIFCHISQTHLFCNPKSGTRIRSSYAKRPTEEEKILILKEFNSIRSKIAMKDIQYGDSSFLNRLKSNVTTKMMSLVSILYII